MKSQNVWNTSPFPSSYTPVVPVLGLLCLGILDHLGREEVPVLLQGAGLRLLVVDQDLVGVVRVQDQGVQVGEHVVLASNVLKERTKILLSVYSCSISPTCLGTGYGTGK
jgi:hypothetical protein